MRLVGQLLHGCQKCVKNVVFLGSFCKIEEVTASGKRSVEHTKTLFTPTHGHDLTFSLFRTLDIESVAADLKKQYEGILRQEKRKEDGVSLSILALPKLDSRVCYKLPVDHTPPIAQHTFGWRKHAALRPSTKRQRKRLMPWHSSNDVPGRSFGVSSADAWDARAIISEKQHF